MVKNLHLMQVTSVQFLAWEDPLEEGMETYSSILACRIPTDRGVWGTRVHGVSKSQTLLSDYAQHRTEIPLSKQLQSSFSVHNGLLPGPVWITKLMDTQVPCIKCRSTFTYYLYTSF